MKPILYFALVLFLCFFTACKEPLAPVPADQVEALAQFKKNIYTTYLPYYQPIANNAALPEEDVTLKNFQSTNHPDLTAALGTMPFPPTLGTTTSNPGGTVLTVSFLLPETFQSSDLMAKMGQHNITDNNGQPVEFHPFGTLNSGRTRSHTTEVDGMATTSLYRVYTIFINNKKAEYLELPLKGSAEIFIGYIGGHDFVHFKPEETGKTVDYKGGKITLIAIEGNTASYQLEGLSMGEADPVITNDAGEMLDFSPSNPEVLSKKYTNGAIEVPATIEAIFRNNPNISEEEFGDKAHNFLLEHLQNEQQLSNDLVVNRFLFPIQNLSFYTPKMAKKYRLEASF